LRALRRFRRTQIFVAGSIGLYPCPCRSGSVFGRVRSRGPFGSLFNLVLVTYRRCAHTVRPLATPQSNSSVRAVRVALHHHERSSPPSTPWCLSIPGANLSAFGSTALGFIIAAFISTGQLNMSSAFGGQLRFNRDEAETPGAGAMQADRSPARKPFI